MSQQGLPVEGGCRCGQVRMRITAPPLLTMACHCTGCQQMTASAFSLSVAVPAEGFEVIQGEPVIGALHAPEVHHYYCPWCMSWMFTRPQALSWFVNVRSTLLDDARWTTPFMETMASEKLPWVKTPAVHSFAQFPDAALYPGLIAEFQGKA
ncbi:GFA family protein [Phenylobacterium sp.]|uniref:GFA family protein n=1 Tax=Phenylobacterium sp. TaxID=1871053 RepID=UPI002DE508DF|nr:GFA family protein [Phenylobacterium sp.]